MKAWKVWDEYGDGSSTVVFAETSGKAKSQARYTDVCEDTDWINIRVNRFRDMDAEYRGKAEMDWYDEQDRLALVKAGWSCLDMEVDECAECVAKDACDKYHDYLRERTRIELLEDIW